MLCVIIIILSHLQIVLDLASESSFKPATLLCPFDMGSSLKCSVFWHKKMF